MLHIIEDHVVVVTASTRSEIDVKLMARADVVIINGVLVKNRFV